MSFRTYADLWALDIVNQTWTLATYDAQNPPPSARAHAFLGFDGNHSLVLFGGAYNTPAGVWVYFGDTWLFDLHTWRWTNVTAQLPVSPSARAGGVSTYHEEIGFVICGGKDSNRAYMDVWLLGPVHVRRAQL